MLYACLTRLQAARAEDVHVVVSLDRAGSSECVEAAQAFASSDAFAGLHLRQVPPHRFHGNSYNVLTGMRDCLTFKPDLLHVVEEDIFVAATYFSFHEDMHRAVPDAFAVSACRNQNAMDDGAAYTHPSYQSLGVSLRPKAVELVLEHAVPAYFRNMVGYCTRTFPSSAIPAPFAEQDGLVNRVREGVGGVTVYTARPRAYHAGFYGYNRQGRPLSGGSLVERAERLLAMSSGELNAHAVSHKDHETVDLNSNLSTTLEVGALGGVYQI
jgi:hypothetical protein